VERKTGTVENSLHWVLDVTMNEDQSRNRKGHGPQNLALLRRWALNACKIEGSKGSIKGKLKHAGWNDEFLARLLSKRGRSVTLLGADRLAPNAAGNGRGRYGEARLAGGGCSYD
jgi:hypothetical protein